MFSQTGSRYDGQVAVFGSAFQKKLSERRYFVVSLQFEVYFWDQYRLVLLTSFVLFLFFCQSVILSLCMVVCSFDGL